MLSTEDYLLVEHDVHVDKCAAIVAIVQLIAALDKSVLVLGKSHAAVDSILLALKKIAPDLHFLKVGGRDHQELIGHGVEAQLAQLPKTSAALRDFYNSRKIVATSCAAISSHAMFEARPEPFDYCVLDDAADVPLPAALGAWFHCKHFVLFGNGSGGKPEVPSLFAELKADHNTVLIK